VYSAASGMKMYGDKYAWFAITKVSKKGGSFNFFLFKVILNLNFRSNHKALIQPAAWK
jgi:hypothetical protein